MTASRYDQSAPEDRTAPARAFDVLIVGAGFGGLYALYKLRGMGLDYLLADWHGHRARLSAIMGMTRGAMRYYRPTPVREQRRSS